MTIFEEVLLIKQALTLTLVQKNFLSKIHDNQSLQSSTLRCQHFKKAVSIETEQQHRATKAKQANVNAKLRIRHQLIGCPWKQKGLSQRLYLPLRTIMTSAFENVVIARRVA